MTYGHNSFSWKTIAAIAGATGSLSLRDIGNIVKKKQEEIIKKKLQHKLLGASTETKTTNSMKLIGPLSGSEATTYSHFKFNPRHRKQRYNHNKATCSSGTLVDHNCYRVKSKVAITAWDFKCVMNKTNLQLWQQVIPATGVGASSDSKRQVHGSTTLENKVTIETANEQTKGRQLYMLSHYKHQFMYQNRNKHPVWIELWDIVIKEGSGNISNNDPISIITSFVPTNEGYSSTLGSMGFTSAEGMTYTHPDFKLSDNKQFHDRWTKKKYTKIRLQPGETHVHSVSATPKFVWDFYGIDSFSGLVEWGGITQGTLMRATGDMVHQEAGDLLPTIDGTNVDVIEVRKVWLRQIDPWRDVFHLNISPTYPSYNAERDTVGRIELENPADTTGKID